MIKKKFNVGHMLMLVMYRSSSFAIVPGFHTNFYFSSVSAHFDHSVCKNNNKKMKLKTEGYSKIAGISASHLGRGSAVEKVQIKNGSALPGSRIQLRWFIVPKEIFLIGVKCTHVPWADCITYADTKTQSSIF